MTIKRGRKLKYIHTLILEGINARDISRKTKSTINDPQTVNPIIEYTAATGSNENITNVSDLTTKKYGDNIFFENTNVITFIDYIKFGCLPVRTDLCCFHCKAPFNTSPIGIPIKYVCKKIKPALEPKETDEVSNNDFFYTFGVTCSWPCCLAFILENSHKHLFRNSKSLLYSLYYKLYNTELKIKAAPSWECLKDYGGILSIDEFRKSFCTAKYIVTENLKKPYMIAVGKYIEEKKCGYL